MACGQAIPTSTHLVIGDQTYPPLGWVTYCQNHPEDKSCLTAFYWQELQTVHTEINQAVQYKPESVDTWQPAASTGDCEDYALAYRNRLLAQHWPSNHLKIGLCRTPTGEEHANLLVLTNHGVKVLDNRMSHITTPATSACTYVAMQPLN